MSDRDRPAPDAPAPTSDAASAAPAPAPAEAAMLGAMPKVLAVEVGGAVFGLRIERVREVGPVPPIARLPFPPAAVIGAASVRGEILAVIDLGARLVDRPASREGRLVVVAHPDGSGNVGLLVDAVAGMVDRADPVADPPPDVAAALPAGWIDEILAPAPDRLVTVLRLGPVLELADSDDKERR